MCCIMLLILLSNILTNQFDFMLSFQQAFKFHLHTVPYNFTTNLLIFQFLLNFPIFNRDQQNNMSRDIINRDSETTLKSAMVQQGVNEQLIPAAQVEQQYAEQSKPKTRLASLDILRGLTITGMLMVDDSEPDGPWWITHAKWDGLTLADLVFPSFVFIMGMAVPLALSQSKPFRLKNIIRIIGLFGIGVFLGIFEQKFNIYEFRVMGILQRISLCYGLLAVIHALTKYGERSYRFIGSLFAIGCGLIYMTFMVTFENIEIGCPKQKNLGEFCNFGAYWDRRMFTKHHMIYPNDPQGLFTTLTSFINGFAGYLFCLAMMDHKGNVRKVMLIWGIASFLCAILALPLHVIMPINKKIWSISYTFLTIGISGFTLILITLACDIIPLHHKRYKKVIHIITMPLIWLGRNPLAIFVSRDLLDDILGTYIIINGKSAWEHLYHYMFRTWISNAEVAALSFAVFLLILLTLEAYILYRNNIFIRL